MSVEDFVHPNEPCYGLYEGPLTVEGVYGWYQVIRVVRNDAIEEFASKLGEVNQFKTVTPLAVPSFGENSVAMLMDMADKNRADDYWYRRGQQLLAESTLIQDAIDENEQVHNLIHNYSVMGPYGSTQRNGYSRRN